MILAAVRAEWFKIVRRPAVSVTIGLFLLLEVGIGYLITYLVATHPPANPGQTGENFANLRASLYPNSFVLKSISNANTLGGIFALILGVLVQGSEYGWETVKTAQTQLPGRLTILAGRLLAVAFVIALMTVGLFLLDAIASDAFAAIDGKAASFPPWVDIAKGIGADWLIFAFAATFGFALATLFRQSAMAIGIGLGYVLVIEGLIFGLLGQLGDTVKQVHTWFPAANAQYLTQAFGSVQGVFSLATNGRQDADATHAVVALSLWVIGLIVLSGALVRVRDVK